ncbi:fibronectin type III domain-containing protein [Solwaraspora sp. WMMA2065]|uniref:fibronectin type III domain-containing protein n=1 Tax=Solwaraspora sp. WMMA2065 TaxID=3015166 RepID=UPI00259B0155|nr:fibronectin type III domain-containing protein [Solwaraspora sp. WMMA2065]WJK34611.1 fibronectin type III domain-containing protein [Solwaraspora sp. WMMA2065]
MGHRHFLGVALAVALVISGPVPAQASAPVTPPGAPQAAGTQFLSATTVDLAWMPAAAGTNPIAAYEVYARRLGWIYPDELVATTTSSWVFVPIGGLRPATNYDLFVRARDTSGLRGPASAPVNITTLPSEIVPGPPVATDVTATTATVSWQPPAVAVERIAGYDLIVPPATPTQPIQIRARTDPSTTSVQLVGLRPGTSYVFLVVVRYTGGTPRSAPSARGAFTTVPSVPPSPPSDLTVTALSPTSATVSWTASTPGDFPISRYYPYVNGVGLGIPNPGPDVRTVTFAVSPGGTYEVYVRAVDQAGITSAPSETVTFTAPSHDRTSPGRW